MRIQSIIVAVTLLSSVFFSCGSGISTDGFSPIPAIHNLDLSNLKPAEPITYVEMRRVYPMPNEEPLPTFGVKCADATNQATCIEEFDMLNSPDGFDYGGCPQTMCHKYLAVNAGDENWTVSTIFELHDFFGTIDSMEEAVLMAVTGRYYWTTEKLEDGAFREISGGYELILLVMLSDCAPILIERHLVSVTEDGVVWVGPKETAYRDENACL